MKRILIFLGAIWFPLHAHELEGQYSRDGHKASIPRTAIPFDGFTKTQDGRVYTLWIAPDGAFVFYIEKPWDGVELDLAKPDQRFRIWLVMAEKELTLPKGFELLSSDEKTKSKMAEELVGKVSVSWKGDSDYLIDLDVKGVHGHSAFKGHLFGGARNHAPKE